MRGHDIVMDLPVTVGQAVAGGKVEAKDIDGNPVTFKVPAGSSSGAEVKLAGLGVQRSNQPGDLIGRVQIMGPRQAGSGRQARRQRIRRKSRRLSQPVIRR